MFSCEETSLCWCSSRALQRGAVVYRNVRIRVCQRFILMVPPEQRNAIFIHDRAKKAIFKGNMIRKRVMFRQIKKAVRISL
jgi:hypothetical protein